MDIFELSKSLIKINSYALSDMIIHFFPNTIMILDEMNQKLENNDLILKITQKLKIFSLTL